MRVDVMSKMRGVDSFARLWSRRTTLQIPGGEKCDLLSLPDLVQAKKTQRAAPGTGKTPSRQMKITTYKRGFVVPVGRSCGSSLPTGHLHWPLWGPGHPVGTFYPGESGEARKLSC